MNVIARLEYELAYYDSAVHRFNHYTTRTPHSGQVSHEEFDQQEQKHKRDETQNTEKQTLLEPSTNVNTNERNKEKLISKIEKKKTLPSLKNQDREKNQARSAKGK